ncbi:hypothetical protein ABZ805_16455 [Saccharopolyspora sp. NPDC047091]|uniref:hypothetical protein n=1 Tax=Saccharopolyspora sp. NPDC047091 TaxID=3155924 RepID=UPI0034010671
MPSNDLARLMRCFAARALLLALALGLAGAQLLALLALLAATGLLAWSGAPAVSRRGAPAAPEPPGW